MREKTLKFVVTFKNTAGALGMEKFCMERRLSGRLIPVPRQISAGCGMAWCAPWEKKELLGEALSRFAGQVQEQHKLWL